MTMSKKTEEVEIVDNHPGAAAPSANVPGPGMAPADMVDSNTPDTAVDSGGAVITEPAPKEKK